LHWQIKAMHGLVRFRSQGWQYGGLPLGELGRGEHGLDRAVVPGRHRIKLVIVAAGALQRVGEERLAHAVGDVVEEPLASDLRDFHGREFPGAHAEEAGGNDLLGIVRVQFIAGELFADELVVRLVAVEGPHHVIAIPPGVAAFKVVGKPRRIGVPHHVQPVLGHALAVVRTGQQAIDQAADGGIRVAGEFLLKLRDLLRRRRQTGQIERRAADPRAGIGRGRGSEPRGHSCGQQRVNRRRPGLAQDRLGYRLVGPQSLRLVLAIRPFRRESAAGADGHAVFRRPRLGVRVGDGLRPSVIRPRSTAGDPGVNPARLLGRQPVGFLRRHRRPVVVLASDGQIRRARLRIARDNAGHAAIAGVRHYFSAPLDPADVPADARAVRRKVGRSSIRSAWNVTVPDPSSDR
jgi:hypothetical protein